MYKKLLIKLHKTSYNSKGVINGKIYKRKKFKRNMTYQNNIGHRELNLNEEKPRPWKTLAEVVFALSLTFACLHLTNNSNRKEDEILRAFSENCGYRTVEAGYGQPNAVAREQFLRLRNLYPKRFEKITNDEGVNQLMESYSTQTRELKIPKYDCD